jgi:agmatine/peptidylarginine deiminase
MYKRKTGSVRGGAIDTNGRGTLLTSEECLMHPDIQVRNQILQRRLRSRFQGISWNYECDLVGRRN